MIDELSARSRAYYNRERLTASSIGSGQCLATSIIWLKTADNHFNQLAKPRAVLSKE